jgi:periplasmic protein TonB
MATVDVMPDQQVLVPPRKRPMQNGVPVRPVRPTAERSKVQPALFHDSLLELSDSRPKGATHRVAFSVVAHIALLTLVLWIPLYFTDALDISAFTQTFLVAPPPPPAPPPAPARTPARAAAPHRVLVNQGKLLAPTVIPEKVAMLKEQPIAPEIGGLGEGVIGGVPGGQLGGVIGGIVSDSRSSLVPPASVVVSPRKPVRVGGRVKPPRLLERVAPVYPLLAKQAHMQGVVQIDAVIDEHGNVVEVKAVSGPPLLIPAAMAAVEQWRYEPTYLNEQAIAVQFLVSVTFVLGE